MAKNSASIRNLDNKFVTLQPWITLIVVYEYVDVDMFFSYTL